MIKNCIICGKPFVTKIPYRKYCSENCRIISANKRVKKTTRNVRCSPIGTERIRHSKGGDYEEIKTRLPNKWTPKNIYVYEKTHKIKVERGKEVVRCLDGNNRNSAPENLMLLTRGENTQVNLYIHRHSGIISPEMMRLVILYIKVRCARVRVAKKHGLTNGSNMIKSDTKKYYTRLINDPVRKELRKKQARESARRRCQNPVYREKINAYQRQRKKKHRKE